MPKFTFDSAELKRGFAMAKIAKPETGDFCLQFLSASLVIFSSDKRRYTRVQIPVKSTDGVDIDFHSDEFFLLADKIALFDSNLESVAITVNDKSLSIVASGGGQSRQATLKKRSISSRRPKMPAALSMAPTCVLPTDEFGELLRQVSCSALIKETKSDEARRINQVHFYPDKNAAVSNARYYESVAFLPGMQADISLVSDDLPQTKSFCNLCSDKNIQLLQDNSRLYILEPSTGSFLALSKINTQKPPFSILDDAGFTACAEIDKAQLSDSLKWAVLAIEGTQRLSFRASRHNNDAPDGTVELSSGAQELSHLPIKFIRGKELNADFPVRFFASIIGYLDEGEVCLKFGHPTLPTILQISQKVAGVVQSHHYLQSMKERA
jgi:hypothetical protein